MFLILFKIHFHHGHVFVIFKKDFHHGYVF